MHITHILYNLFLIYSRSLTFEINLNKCVDLIENTNEGKNYLADGKRTS